MGAVTLGLDLGTNSIGWALIEFDDTKRPQRLIDCGVRIFQEAVDLKTRTPRIKSDAMPEPHAGWFHVADADAPNWSTC